MIENKPAVTSLVVDAEAEAGTAASIGVKKPGSRSGAKKSGSQNRRKSRELVLKAVYRGMLNDSELSQVFRDMRDDPDYNKADEAYFKHLLQAVTENLVAIDDKIVNFIDRSITELSPVEHAILRIAGCELMFDLTIPYRVVINEGVELAKVFGGTDGHKYINGVLDKFAADVREAEVKAARS
ncbi:transcription antitermination factor NusB [Methylotenera oryzisoli]|jgi:N utilization substance protein B|uniref:transcription antitermination factor NusB n=1 Tax=Methylotenera oryzisoli TaxID=2080758 RepID=UPI001ADDD314|nr:transcription antitermination factor NusB [Methylotenera oryzisoli]